MAEFERKKSFLMYHNYQDHIEMLSDSEAGKLLKLLFEKAVMGADPDPGEIGGALGMCYSFISSQMDRDEAKYREKCRKNRENGMKGGRPKAETERFNK